MCGSHAIVSSSVGPEYYVSIMSFVDKAQLEPGCTILLHNKARPLATLCRCPVCLHHVPAYLLDGTGVLFGSCCD